MCGGPEPPSSVRHEGNASWFRHKSPCGLHCVDSASSTAPNNIAGSRSCPSVFHWDMTHCCCRHLCYQLRQAPTARAPRCRRERLSVTCIAVCGGTKLIVGFASTTTAEVGRSVGPFRPPKISAVGRSVQTDSIFSSPRSARQCRAVPTLIFLAALRAAVGRSDRSDPKFSSPRSARRSVGRTRPTRNRPLAREVGRSVGDAKPTINFVPPCRCGMCGSARSAPLQL